jgi:formate/nitrite transporter
VTHAALKIAVDKVSLPFTQALFLGILCNLLVCLAVWLSLGARTTTDRVLAVIFPVSGFVVAGLEHSVADMYFIPLALFIKEFAPADFWTKLGPLQSNLAGLDWPTFFASLVSVTIGNIIGGAVLVGAIYWFVFLRRRLGL